MPELDNSRQEAYASQGFQLLELNDQFVLIAKAGGVGFHDEQEPSGRLTGLFNRVQQCLREDGLIDSPLYPVHRLDKGTSGLMVFARTAGAARELGDAFAMGQVQKFYLALSKHKPKKKQGAVKGGMQKARRGAWKLVSGKDNYAHSQFFSRGLGQGYRLFLWRPRTGRTHQLRVAMKSLGSPILGDVMYGCHEESHKPEQIHLHAYQLAFQLSGKDYRYQLDPLRQQGVFGWQIADSELLAQYRGALEEFSHPDALSWPA